MIETFLTGRYAAFILASYGASFIGLGAMVVWVWLGYRLRARQLAELEKAGFGRGRKA